MQTVQPIKIFDAIAFSATVAFTAAANIITSTAHGLKKDTIIKVASDDTLPAGLSSSVYYFVINPTTDTFQVALEKDGTPVAITDAGTGNHTFTVQGAQNPCFVDGFENIELELFSSNSLNDYTIKFAGSDQEDMPNFNETASETNRWSYVQVKDLADGSSVSGATGVAVSGAVTKLYEVNTNKLRWLVGVVSSFTAGDVTLLVNLANVIK